jgi:TPR repeat/Cytochrome c554 and c-prime
MKILWTLICLYFIASMSAAFALEVAPTPVREADAACARCHERVVRSYLNTPMANASGMALEKLHPGTFTHAPSGTEYTIAERNHQGELAYRSQDGSTASASLPLSYFLGSGHLGTTYLYSLGDFLFESPVAWYSASQSYDMKPGLADLSYMPPPLPMQSGCMRCHMSAAQASDPGTINHYRGLPFLHSGITCEMCHGDGREHVASGGKATIVNPVRLSPENRDSVCISCHLEGDVSVKRAGDSPLKYRPGESIFSYLAFFVRSGANLTDRAVSEVEQLNQSTCKRASGDGMSCMSCHDPHYTPDSAHRAAFFRGKCLVCHNQPVFAKAHHPEHPDCTSCHMPQNGARNVLHVAWTDHRIRKIPNVKTVEPVPEKSEVLVPILSPNVSKRDQAMAEYQALMDGDRFREPAVWEQLNAQREELANDKDALDALGNIEAQRGDMEKAEREFQRVLELDHEDVTALSNLGILLAKQGHLKESAVLLRQAFERNQDIPGLAMNLVRVQCMAGDGAAARATLSAALVYCPNLPDMRRLLAQMGNCGAAGAHQHINE